MGRMYKFHYLIFICCLFISCQQNHPEKQQKHHYSSENSLLDSLSEKTIIAQQFIVKCTAASLKNIDSIKNQLALFQPGGIYFENWPVEYMEDLVEFIDTNFKIKPFLMGDYFDFVNTPEYPIWATNKAFCAPVFWKGFQEGGVNWVGITEDFFGNTSMQKYFEQIYEDSLVNPILKIKLNELDALTLKHKLKLIQHSRHTLLIESYFLDSLPYRTIRTDFDFDGLFIINSQKNPLNHLKAGADMILINDFNQLDSNSIKLQMHSKESVQNILKVKNRFMGGRDFKSFSARMKANKYHIQAKATVLIKNEAACLPVKKLHFIKIEKLLQTEKKLKFKPVVCFVPANTNDSILQLLNQHASAASVIFVFSKAAQLKFLKKCPNLCFNPFGITPILRSQLMGGLPINGNFYRNNKIYKGIKRAQSKLAYVAPEYAFVDPGQLNKISGIVHEAIAGKAFPGCQVLGIRNGVVVYQYNFGRTAYSNGEKVSNLHVYDLASLTKVLSTTLVGMKLWEDGYYKLDDKIGPYLPDTLAKYLPNGSSISNITFRELFIHQSGLPAGFPVLPYMKKAADKTERFYNGYCDYPYEGFQTQVAKDLYLDESFQDSMWVTLNSLWLDPQKTYKYSDVNMNLLYFLFKRMIDTHSALKPKKLYRNRNTFEEFIHSNFYEPLGMFKTGFNPLNYTVLNKIVPTENETYWRKQLLQGFVHDPNAALYGGVAGNAGLYSNVQDLSILIEMWQNGGVYNEKRYLKAATISTFIKTQNGTHRGLGFNKRTFTNAAFGMADAADQNTYGHTGFTGTCFWIDPTEKLSFVFLSNRVHPKINNKIYQFKVRKRIHEVFYQALLN